MKVVSKSDNIGVAERKTESQFWFFTARVESINNIHNGMYEFVFFKMTQTFT